MRQLWEQALQPCQKRLGSGYLIALMSSAVFSILMKHQATKQLLTGPRILRGIHARNSGRRIQLCPLHKKSDSEAGLPLNGLLSLFSIVSWEKRIEGKNKKRSRKAISSLAIVQKSKARHHLFKLRSLCPLDSYDNS